MDKRDQDENCMPDNGNCNLDGIERKPNMDEDLGPPYIFHRWKIPDRGVCKHWLDGYCPKSEEVCPFAHFGTVEKKPQICKFFRKTSNGCSKGKACLFMHETYPCPTFHVEGQCVSPNCKLSHAQLDDVTRPIIKKEVVQMVSDIKENIQDEILTEEKQRSLMRLHAIRAVAVNMNIVIPDDSVEDDESLMAKSSKVETTGQEVDFAGYHGPNGGQSTLRYALHGTFGNYKYAQENMDKFEAYEEMERRVQTLYNHISIDNYSTLSEQLRGII